VVERAKLFNIIGGYFSIVRLKKYKVYILFSDLHKKTYVGFSEDSERRLQEHNSGKVASTEKYKPWRIVYEEEIDNYSQARRRELYYKSGAGRRKIKSIFDELKIHS